MVNLQRVIIVLRQKRYRIGIQTSESYLQNADSSRQLFLTTSVQNKYKAPSIAERRLKYGKMSLKGGVGVFEAPRKLPSSFLAIIRIQFCGTSPKKNWFVLAN